MDVIERLVGISAQGVALWFGVALVVAGMLAARGRAMSAVPVRVRRRRR